MTPTRTSALPPGPQRSRLPRFALGKAKDPLEELVEWQQQYGDIVTFPTRHGPAWLLSHPDHVQYVLADKASNYLNMAGDHPDPLLGRGLFASKGDFWLRQRRMVQPAFHRPRLARMVEGMVRDVEQLAERWARRAATSEPLELLEQMRGLVITMLGTSIFSEDVRASRTSLREGMDYLGHEFHGTRDSLMDAVRRLFGRQDSRMKRFLHAIEQVNTDMYRLIAERRQSAAGKDDIMTMLLEARDAQGVAMTDSELRDELVNLFIGGYESTAVALTWMLYEMTRHPEVEQRARGELATVLGGQPLTAESLPSLLYTRAMVEETLRVHPPAWAFMRRALNEDELGGYFVAPETKMLISPYILHRHPGFWSEPERFLPERFLPEQKEGRHRFAYLPFGAGQRQCVGNGYTVTLLTVALATLLQHCQWRLVPGHPVIAMAATTRRPRNGVLATLHAAPLAA
ncbi:cytochrome P450 [Pyxidicoccus fallax]|uniref:Cytochrome P450 n=1 Tax=Pyxidicoccus fallax TaxID=394095 RepID=A0A848LYC8_9BACT|nr:cytochrome P450 [Pyxidicoccus fallax]NMO22631.1 cytochrome P450 [Pyxidicoccus fallax]NPC78415.1 cytochrome P450 [Pyxidicoccus fallax]